LRNFESRGFLLFSLFRGVEAARDSKRRKEGEKTVGGGREGFLRKEGEFRMFSTSRCKVEWLIVV
jgi:hypothetical protein